MNFQNEMLPQGAQKIGSTPTMTEETVVPGISFWKFIGFLLQI